MSINSNKQLKQFFNQEAPILKALGTRLPACKHFGECGGCALQDLDYDKQLALKQLALERIFVDSDANLKNIPLIASPRVLNYRLRMDYVVNFHPHYQPHQRLGLRKRNKFDFVLNLEECVLLPEPWFERLRQVYAFILDQGLRGYDLKVGGGDIRYMVIRNSGERAMLSIVTAHLDLKDKLAKIAEFALETGFTSVKWQHNPSVGDTSTGETIQSWGADYLQIDLGFKQDKLQNLKLNISEQNFFQNNLGLFTQLLDWVAVNLPPQRYKLMLDLYSGVGTIGLAFANIVDRVVGVELVKENVELALVNAKANKVDNVEFIQADVGAWVSETEIAPDLMVVDPPRVGLQPKGVEQILKLQPRVLVYISCNPITQKLDLKEILPYYEVVTAQAFDMFPQTLHLENVVILRKR